MMSDEKQFYLKVFPPHRRARIHKAECKHCRHGQGQENQDKGTGPTYWVGFTSFAEADAHMKSLDPRFKDVGVCQYCKPA